MSTQPYSPQSNGAPPARSSKFALQQGLAEQIALANVPGELVPSEFGASEVRYRLVDGRAWYVPQVVADEINIRIAPRQQFEVLRYGRAKHELRITPLQANLGPPPPPEPQYAPPAQRGVAYLAPPAQPAQAETTVNAKFVALYMVAIDTLLEAKVYAQRKGLALEIRCEDVRALAATIAIDRQKCGAQ